MNVPKLFSYILAILIITGTAVSSSWAQKSMTLYSPDHQTEVHINIKNDITYAVKVNQKQVLDPTAVALSIENHGVLGKNPELKNSKKEEVNRTLHPVVQEKSSAISDHFNRLTLKFSNHFQIVFRAYNLGVAYRFKTNFSDGNIKVNTEHLTFNFAHSGSVYFPEEESFMTHQEGVYKYARMDTISSKHFSSLPALVTPNQGPKVLLTEVDLRDYPGYYLQGTSSNAFKGIFPAVATDDTLKSDRGLYVIKRADYIAKTSGSRSFPWRVVMISKNDSDLITNQLVYKLAKPLQLDDTSWINPGKVAWDWWNANNVYDVDFHTGINNKTYKYYIDFASKMGLDYIILDEGWYKLRDLTTQSPNIDIEKLVKYGKKKNVDIILWVVWKTLDDQWQKAFDEFSRWGIKGIKVDFMQRDDQWMVNWYWKVAREAAKRHLLVDFHGAYKPTGIRRAYPNVITREAVKGLENDKWSKLITPTHDMILPFVRMPAGPMDYTPGAMINAQPKNFKTMYNRPMSQGTRVHQLAMYVLYESPLQMLADSPTHYLNAPQNIRDYLSEVPVTWDETNVLKAKAGNYLVIARRKGNRWYIGGMTNEKPRDFDLDLSFLDTGSHQANIYKDGINADRYGSDYDFVSRQIQHPNSFHIHMAQSGGWVAVIK